MVTHITNTDWLEGQDALHHVVGQVACLLRSIRDPSPPALGQWNLGEVAMHLSQAWIAVPAIARGDLSRVRAGMPGVVDAAAGSLIQDMWDLGQTTVAGVKSDPERNLSVLADRIELRAQEYLAECEEADPNAPRPWLVDGATVRQSMLTYHLLSETIIHGYDMAHAAGHPWPIEPAHAAMVWGRFLVPVFQALPPRAMVAPRSGDVQATFEIIIRDGDRFHFIFNHGELTVEEPSSRTVDCYISADPVAILLVAWDRESQWPLVAEGKLETWGPKAYLGPQFRSLLRNP